VNVIHVLLFANTSRCDFLKVLLAHSFGIDVIHIINTRQLRSRGR